jgi:hypothetical protein
MEMVPQSVPPDHRFYVLGRPLRPPGGKTTANGVHLRGLGDAASLQGECGRHFRGGPMSPTTHIL